MSGINFDSKEYLSFMKKITIEYLLLPQLNAKLKKNYS